MWPSHWVLLAVLPAACCQMSNLVSEKDLGLRLALRNMGMRDSSYWTSWMLFDAIITLLTALLVVVFGEGGCAVGSVSSSQGSCRGRGVAACLPWQQ